MVEPYTINASCQSISISLARMALARTMRDHVYDTVKDWHCSPEQETMICGLAMTVLCDVPVFLTETVSKKAVGAEITRLMEKFPLQTFCGIPIVVDPAMEKDKIELRDQEGNILVRIISLSVPCFSEVQSGTVSEK